MAGNSTQLRGLGLPALRRGGGYFATKTKYDVAWGDLILAVLTPINSRPMNRAFGSALHNVLYEPSVPAIQGLTDYVIREAASKWTPHIQIDTVAVKVDKDTVKVGIIFSLIEDRISQERVIFITKSDIIGLLAAERRA